MKKNTKIPVTIITGFLGAGKTTFINQLLQNYSKTQFALVENEFGDVAIDSKLIKGVDASQLFELKQGCICCTISNEFELVLQELAERFPNVEHLLIETTGVADPAQVVQPFFSNEDLKETFQYNGTICLVDAINFENSPEKEITIKQAVVADLVLVSKAEHFSEIQKEDFKNKLQKISPFAEIDFLSGGLGVPDLNSLLQKTKTTFDFLRLKDLHSKIQSKTLSFNQPVNKEEFIRWLSYTLDVYKKQIYRTKGIVCFENEPFEFVIQGVGGSFEITEGDIILDKHKSELVFIGKLEDLNLAY